MKEIKKPKVVKIKEVNWKKLKNKMYTLFAVVSKEYIKNGKCNLNEVNNFFTISDNIYDCEEYIILKEMLDHKQHYQSWCQQRKLDYLSEFSWKSYKEIVLHNSSEYGIITFKMEWKDIMAFLRVLHKCYPIGCSYDREIELSFFKEQVVGKFLKEAKDQVENNLKEINKEDIVN